MAAADLLSASSSIWKCLTPTRSGRPTTPCNSTPSCASSRARSDGERMAAEFVLKLLKKRLFSSPAAFGITLEKHIATVGGRKSASTATRDIEEFYGDDYADDEEYEN